MEFGNGESEDVAGASAISVLGSLFKLTEVFLWDDETEVAGRVESSVEKNFLNGKLKAIAAYFSNNSMNKPMSSNA